MKKLALFTVVLGLLPLSTIAQSSIRKTLYNSDSRVEADQHPDRRLRDYSNSVAGMVRNYQLLKENPITPDAMLRDLMQQLQRLKGLPENDDDLLYNQEAHLKQVIQIYQSNLENQTLNADNEEEYFYFDKQRTLKRTMNVCQSERFADQPVLANCTGFLIADDVLVTAGHCIENVYQCRNFSWVFGFKHNTDKIKKSDVYRCKEILSQNLDSSRFVTRDYAIIRLDRSVTDREPLPIRTSGRVGLNEELAIIGHPSGLPLKTADSATVKSSRINFFYSDLDAFQGNSGSPVINRASGLVEGILVEGGEDYFFDEKKWCYVPSLKGSRDKVEEKVYRINRIPDIMSFL